PSLLQHIKDTEASLKQNKSVDAPGTTRQESDDEILTRAFQRLVSKAALAAEPSQRTYEDMSDSSTGILRAGNYEEFKKSLWETGKLDIEHRLELDKRSPDSLGMIKDLAAATPEERERAFKMVGNEFNQYLHVSDEEKQLVDMAIKQGGVDK